VIARALGVRVIERELPEDGWMRWTENGPIVCLSLDAGLARGRFTLAHELGHVLLRGAYTTAPDPTRARRAFHSEETFCDALAGGLLMPRSWVSKRFEGAPRGFATIQSLARAAGVSLSAAIVRLREVHGWQRTLLQWRAKHGSWVYDAEAGMWPSEQGAIKPSAGTPWALNERRSRGYSSCRMYLPLRIGGDERNVDADVHFCGDRAIVLVDSPALLLAG
jgi:hypothetical protein